MSQIEQMQEGIDHHSKRADRAEAINAELLEALKALRSFMWKEGYTDTTAAMVKADVAISNATGGAE